MLLITVATTPFPFSWPSRLHVPAAHQQHRVAIDDAAGAVDENRAIAVAVERHAEAAAALDDHAREVLRVRRAAVEVDVASVGRRR